MVVKHSRAQRRHDRERMYQHARRVVGLWFQYLPPPEEITRHKAHLLRDNLKACSCWMCGNSRKFHTGKSCLTLQERKADVSFDEQIKELDDTNDPF